MLLLDTLGFDPQQSFLPTHYSESQTCGLRHHPCGVIADAQAVGLEGVAVGLLWRVERRKFMGQGREPCGRKGESPGVTERKVPVPVPVIHEVSLPELTG